MTIFKDIINLVAELLQLGAVPTTEVNKRDAVK